MAKKIFITKNADNYSASLGIRNSRVWNCGKTIPLAIGKLIMSYPKKFEIEIIMPDPTKRDFYWTPHEGSFVIEVTKKCPMELIPKRGVVVKDQKIKIKSGTIRSIANDIKFCVGNKSFYIYRDYLKAICTFRGKFIWKNKNYEKMR